MAKTAWDKYLPTILVIFVVAVGLQYMGFVDWRTMVGLTAVAPPGGVVPSGTIPPTGGVTQVIISDNSAPVTPDVVTKDKWNPSTDVDLCGLIYLDGTKKTDFATTSDADFSMSVGKTATLFLGGEETDYKCGVSYGQNATQWYMKKVSYTAPNEEKPTMESIYVCKEGDPTITVYSDDGTHLISDGVTNESIGAGQVVNWQVKIRAASKTCFGQPLDANIGVAYGSVYCLTYNKTDVTKIELRDAAGASEFPVVTNPKSLSYTSTTTSAKCWSLNGISIENSNVNYGTLYVEFTSDYAPDVATMSGKLYDVAMYLNPNVAGLAQVKFGVEDELGNNVGDGDVTGTIYYY